MKPKNYREGSQVKRHWTESAAIIFCLAIALWGLFLIVLKELTQR